MPLYEYECSACKKRFELLQKYSDEPAMVCVRCGGPAIRLLSSPAIQFKGTGWYVTDYGKGSAAGESKKPSKDEAGEKPAASSEGTTASKESTATTPAPASTSTEPAKS